MKNARRWSAPLLWIHLFVMIVWLCLLREFDTPNWMIHVAVWSILAIQFTWGLTVGLIVGPGRTRRPLLWWSLLTIFLPLWPIGHTLFILSLFQGPLIALMYLAVFTIVLASETFCGIMLGTYLHSQDEGTGTL